MRRNALPAFMVVALVALAHLSACGGGEAELPASTPAGETPTQAPTAEPTPTPERPTPAPSPRTDFSLCLVTFEEAEEALGEFIRGQADVSGTASPYCDYDTDSGTPLRIALGSRGDFAAGAELDGVGSEPVPGVGDEAVWFGAALGVLSVRQDDVYLRIVLDLPGVDTATQLEIAKGLAAKAVERIP